MSSPEKRTKEYELGLTGRDTPRYDPEKVEIMKEYFNQAVDELVKLDKSVKDISSELGIPTHERINYLRVVKKAWKLAVRKKAPDSQYKEEILAMARKYKLDIAKLNRLLKAVGLPDTGGRR